MSVLILPGRFKGQPQHRAEIDWSHKALNGVSSAIITYGSANNWTKHQGRRILQPTFSGTAATGNTHQGQALLFNGTDTYLDYGTENIPSSEFTVLWGGVFHNLDGFRGLADCIVNGVSGWSIFASSGDTLWFAFNHYGGYLQSSGWPLSKPVHGALRNKPGVSADWFRDGLKIVSAAGASPIAATVPFWIGSQRGGGFPNLSASLTYFYLIDRYLDDATIIELQSNPSQIFKARARRLWAVSASASHDLLAENLSQENITDQLIISQDHTLVGEESLQVSTTTDLSVVQKHVIGVGPLSQENIGSTLGIAQNHNLFASGENQTNIVPSAQLAQKHGLIVEGLIQSNASSGLALSGQEHLLLGATSIQNNATTGVAITKQSIWYVRPDTSHNVTRDGNTYETAWGGWSSIVWGASGVKAGDLLYVCGAHGITSTISVGNHGATASSRVVISGGYAPDPGSIIVSAVGGVFLFNDKNYTTLESLTVTANKSNCVYLYAASLTGVTLKKCTFNGGSGAAMIGIGAANGQTYNDITIDDCDFVGGSGAPLGGAVTWTVSKIGAPVSNLNRVTISNNRFSGCSAERAVIQLRLENDANSSANMTDIVVTNNTFTSCSTLGMEIIGPSVYGRNTGIRVIGNKFYDMTATNAAFNLGGAMGIGGFGPSLTQGFGPNVIANNEGYRLEGPSGFLNLFYGSYDVYGNYAEDVTATQADANGLLFDHGCDDCEAYDNEFVRVVGNPASENSGCGIMVLDAKNITVHDNFVYGCKIGIYFGDKKTVAQSSYIYDNEFHDCSLAGVLVLSGAELGGANVVEYNTFKSSSYDAVSVRVASGVWIGESNNDFYDFAPPVGHTLHATDSVYRNLVAPATNQNSTVTDTPIALRFNIAAEESNQGNATNDVAVVQTHTLATVIISQVNISSSGDITQGLLLVNGEISQGCSVSSPSITQIHSLGGGQIAQENALPDARISLNNDLTAGQLTQVNYTSDGGINIIYALIGLSHVQGNTVSHAAVSVEAGSMLYFNPRYVAHAFVKNYTAKYQE
ncbi:MAG TPA: right-handed parallel beta-helix repeat-containing protein [Candidatus Saccharimonadales bacterium]|nr:right-handed parallel beta-helix repeat-containing protein [Candidatus Saccharimonadales bacterium]